MKALVTGGAGFIGSAIVRQGLQAGHEIAILDNFSTGYQENIPDHSTLTVIEGDIRDTATLGQAMDGVDVVFHLAAAVGNVRSIENPVEDSEVNIIGTLRVMETMRQHNIQNLILSSSAAIFGEPVRMPLDEGHPCEPSSPYGVSKLAAEKHALCYGAIYGWQVACLRYFNVYGVNQRYDAYGNVIPIFVSRMLNQQPMVIYGDGAQTRDFVNVEDVARANWLAYEHRAQGAFNIGTGAVTTVNQLATLINASAEIPVAVQHTAPRPGEVLHSRADISRAQDVFNFQPTIALAAGLQDYTAWMKLTLHTQPIKQ